MLIGWYEFDASDRSGRGILNYFLAPSVGKSAEGLHLQLNRDPAPELLAGDPDQMVRFLQHLPFTRRFSAMTMTFAEGDVPVAAFNRGDREQRDRVGKAVTAVLELAYLHVPPEKRPPVLVGTHTHTGRLEVNLLLPRAVLAGHGRYMSWNPCPPTPRHREMWDLQRQLINARFGWAEPTDPRRTQWVSFPSWLSKSTAELERHGLASAHMAILEFGQQLVGLAATKAVPHRKALRRHLRKLARKAGYRIYRPNDKSMSFIPIDPERTKPKKFVLKGRLFEDRPYALVRQDQAEFDARFVAEDLEDQLFEKSEDCKAMTAAKYGKEGWNPQPFDPSHVLVKEQECIAWRPIQIIENAKNAACAKIAKSRKSDLPKPPLLQTLIARLNALADLWRDQRAARRIARILAPHLTDFQTTQKQWRTLHDYIDRLTKPERHAPRVPRHDGSPRSDAAALGGRSPHGPLAGDHGRDHRLEHLFPADRRETERRPDTAARPETHGRPDRGHPQEPSPDDAMVWRSPREGSRGWLIRSWLAGEEKRPQPEDGLEM
ncbi:hypothetical protein HJ526_07800 [Donghicola sp. C2-DW-16]|uniref:Uncharacterized protein n=1 Tax=Donghicola mangrovi TaxID=2729614 RepID=A0ABX2PET7_9RHOB|nr:hypothetical protein [Donghicola mangrovi]NVO27317.1 hypothetical protein [Donghicola mangrovi]